MNTRNAELLNAAANRIEAIPESYDQTTEGREDARSPCGTVSCMAGEIVICSQPTVEMGLSELWRLRSKGISYVCDAARELTGLTRDEIPAPIFGIDASVWPEPYGSDWFAARGNIYGKAAAAAAFLRYLANGGEVSRQYDDY